MSPRPAALRARVCDARFRRILCAPDSALPSCPALPFAVELAWRTHGHVDVVHALSTTPHERAPTLSANELRSWREAAADFERRVTRAVPRLGVPVRAHVRSGTLAQATRFVAESERADLVVLSRSTLHLVDDNPFEDEVAHLLDGGAPPLLVVPDGRGALAHLPVDRPCRVLAPLIGADRARAALHVADALADALHGELVVTTADDRFWMSALSGTAEDTHADLVVVERPAEGVLSRLLHGGSLVERLVERTRVPLLVLDRPLAEPIDADASVAPSGVRA